MCSLLSLTLAFSMWTVAVNTTSETEPVSAATDYGLVDNVQEGQILQCWNWSFNNIKNNMAKIAEQGFSAIQTSPIQGSKESTTEYYCTMSNSWWVYYQPINFNIETNSYNALGTASQFKAMCAEAEKYGIKVIVDAVLNHTANNNKNNTVSTMVPSDLRNDSSCWHDISRNSWYETRWDITQFCMEGIPDLNTGNSKVQNYAINFLKECIDAGADGFRFDGAKHIEVPTDFDYASNFWPNVIGSATNHAKNTKGFTPYYYGEILDGPTGYNDKVNGQDALNSYMNYMSVTQSSVSNSIRKAVEGGNAKTAARSDFYFEDGTSSKDTKSVLWNESHDTYISGHSSGVSTTNMNKTWALVGTRKNAAGLYMARPSNPTSTMLGAADSTGWSTTAVKAVNQFKNKYVGQSEYLSDYSNFAMIERGTTGAVIVNTTGTSSYVDINAYVLSNGTYEDAITGNTFTVSNGKIKGNMGSTGIAVVTKKSPNLKLSTSSVKVDKGSTLQVKSTFSFGSVTWKIADTSVASFSAVRAGATYDAIKVKGLKMGGSTTLTCTHSDGTKISIPIKVNSVKLSATTVTVDKGSTVQVKAGFASGSVTWKIADTSVATFSAVRSGATYDAINVKGLKMGASTTLTCTHSDGTKVTIDIKVPSVKLSTASVEVAKGSTLQVKACFASGSVTWSIADTSVATFSAVRAGSTYDAIKVKGVKKGGSTTLTCTHSDGTVITIPVTVS